MNWINSHGARRPRFFLPPFGGAFTNPFASSGARAFAPTDIAGLQLWLKADAGTYKDAAKTQPATAQDDAWYTWADQSGNGNDVVQATAGQRPLTKLNVQNGLPCYYGTGAAATLMRRASAGATLAQPNTCYAVAIAVDGTGNYTVFDDFAGTTRNSLFQRNTLGGRWELLAGANLNSGAGGTGGNWALLTSVFNGASSSIRLNGSVYASGNAGTDSLVLVTIGANYADSAYFANYIGEILIYNGLHTPAQIAQVELYLNTRWLVY